MANSCRQTRKSWRTHAFTQQTRVKSQHTPICKMAAVVQWYLRRVHVCALLYFMFYRQRMNRRKRRRNRKIWTNPTRQAQRVLREKRNLPAAFKPQSLGYFFNFLLVIFCIFIRRGRNIPQSRTIVHFINELKCHFFLSLIRYFVRCNANYVNRARILVGSRSTNHVCQSLTRQIRAYQHKKDGENRDKFYMVANTFPT